MKHLIILSGVGSTGKTTSLLKVAKHLDDMPSVWSKLKDCPPCKNCQNDKVYIFKHKVREKTVGINSAGDLTWFVTEAVKLFETDNCDIVICATKASSVNKGGNYKNSSVIAMQDWIRKYSAEKEIAVVPLFKLMHGNATQTQDDDFTKNVIVNMIDAIIGGADIGAIY